MIQEIHRITIVRMRKPDHATINYQLQWLGSSLGLFSLRDKDRSCFRIFIELLKAAKSEEALTSDHLAAKLKLSRGTVIHHINKLMEAGIVVSSHNTYSLRMQQLEELVSALEKDVAATLENLRTIAREIDDSLVR